MGKTIKEIYDELLSQGRHYQTDYVDIADLIKESSYLLYEFKDSTEELNFYIDKYDTYVKEKSPLFYDRVINNKNNQELLGLLTEEVPFYHLTPSLYVELDDVMLSETRDIGINNVPSALQESDFYETWFRDAFGYVQNLIILDVYNKLRYPYINENQYLDARIFSKLAKTAFNEGEDSESRIIFKDTEELNKEVYDSSYKYFGEEVGAIDYINDIIEKKIVSNYCFIDFSSEQSNFLSNLIDSLYESGQISYADTYSEKLIFKLQEIKNELLRRKLTGTQTLYRLALSSINRNGSYVGLIKASDANVETNTTLTTASSANKNRPIRLLNTPGFITKTIASVSDDIDPIKTFYENPEENDKIPLKLLVPIYYTSADIFNMSTTGDSIKYNNEAFYTNGSISPQDSTIYEYINKSYISNYKNLLLRDNANFIQLDALESIISQDSLTEYHNTLDQLTTNEYGEVVWRTLDDTVVYKDGTTEPYSLDMSTQIIDLETIFSNALDVNADHIMYHYNSVQQKLGVYYDYLTYPIADGNGVCLMDTFWLNYVSYQLENKTKVNDNTLIGTQISTFVNLSANEGSGRQATYEFFGISYADDTTPFGKTFSYDHFIDKSTIKYILLWYCTITYDTTRMTINDVKKTLITKISLKKKAPSEFYDNIYSSEEKSNLKSEYKDCEIYTKYNVGILPFTYKSLVNERVNDIKLGFFTKDNANVFYDDAEAQGYAKSMFVFSKYDLTSLASGKNTDPYLLGENPIFTNELCEGIKTVYYAIKKTKKIEYKNTTESGDIKYMSDGSVVSTEFVEYFSWSDPIRVVELNEDFSLFVKNINHKNIHFSPDWEGLCYYLNPYLNFIEKSASSLRHKPVYKSYNTLLYEVPTINPNVEKRVVDKYFDLKSKTNVSNGDLYYVTSQDSYYIYDSKEEDWYIYDTREVIEGPSESTVLSNLARMRRLDFISNDIGEIRPTHWSDPKYYPEYGVDLNHESRKIYGLYLEKVQPSFIDRNYSFETLSNIFGDNRNKDIYDIEYTNVEYIEGTSTKDLPEIDKANENTLYYLVNGNDIAKYIFLREDTLTGRYQKVTDEDLKLHSSIYYDEVTKIPCLKIDGSFDFNPSDPKDGNASKKIYNNYLKLSPCSDNSLLRQKIYVERLSDIPNYTSLSDREKESLFVVTNTQKTYIYKNGIKVLASEEDSINDKELKNSKKYWYWNKNSEDGLTVCFDLEIFGNNFYVKPTGTYSEFEIYYSKDNEEKFSKKRPTDYPNEIGTTTMYSPEYYYIDSENVPAPPYFERKNYYADEEKTCHYGNYYFEKVEGGYDPDLNLWAKKEGSYVKLDKKDVFNRKCEYYDSDYHEYIPDNYNYGSFIFELNKELFIIQKGERYSAEKDSDLPKDSVYIYENNKWILCGNDSEADSYKNKYEPDHEYYYLSIIEPEINDQLSTDVTYYEKEYNLVDGKMAKAYPESDTSPVLLLYKQIEVTEGDETEIVYEPCVNERFEDGLQYFIFDGENYIKYSVVGYQAGALLPAFYVNLNNKYVLASGVWYEDTDYYTLNREYKKYTPYNLYETSIQQSDNYYIKTNTNEIQTLASRVSSDTGDVNSEFSINIEQVKNKNACCINFYFYPTGKNSKYWKITSDNLNIDEFDKKNFRISASIYTVDGESLSENSNITTKNVTMTIIVDNNVKSKSFIIASDGRAFDRTTDGTLIENNELSIENGSSYDRLGLPCKYKDTESNSLGDIYLFSNLENGEQKNIFFGNVYDFRLYNRGKSPEELLLLNLGTMRELYSYSPSIYKLAHSIYNDLGYLRIVNNAVDDIEAKHVGAIRVFNRSVWDSIMVDNFPVSVYEMDPSSPQYYENYNNPKYDVDVYNYVSKNGETKYYLNDCIEQTLLDRLEVFNGRALEQSTIVKYGDYKNEDPESSKYILDSNSKVTAVFSTLMPIDYNNESISSGNLKFSLSGNTVVSNTTGDNDRIVIGLKADSSDDYFRYSADMSPNFLIGSDFDLSTWLSRGSNVSLTYDSNTDYSYATISDNSIKDSMVNNILVPLVIPKQTKSNYNTVGYLDKFYISNFKLSEYLIKLLRATSYYSELRIPQPCKRLMKDKTLMDTTELIGQDVPTFFIDEDSEKVLAQGTFENNTIYYHRNDDLSYSVTTDYYVGDTIPVVYNKIGNNYTAAYGTYQSGLEYYSNEYVYKPSFYNKWDGIRVLKEGTYFTTCKYPIRFLPFNDEEFDSSAKLNYATVYGSVRFKIEVTSSTKEMSADEIEKYNIKNIPNKYLSDKIVSTLKNPAELIDPKDNKTFPHREMHIKLYAMDTLSDSKNIVDLAGYMKKVNNVYEEQYGFRWNLIASNDYLDCYEESWTHPKEIIEGHNYFRKEGNKYVLYDTTPEFTELCYEFNYVNNGVTYLNKKALDNGCVITQSVAMFMSKNYSLPFFISGQVKTEDDEAFIIDSTSADDDLIEPIKIRPNFNKFESIKDSTKGDENLSISNVEENIIASKVDDLDKIVLVAGKSYKVLFDYTAKVSELAFINDYFNNDIVGDAEKQIYSRYYSLIDNLGIIDSNYEYITDGNAFSIPSTYADYSTGYKIIDTFKKVEVTVGKPILENTYFTNISDDPEKPVYEVASGEFKPNTVYYIRESSTWATKTTPTTISNREFALGDPQSKESARNEIITWANSQSQQSLDNLINSYKINYMSYVEENIRNINDINNTTYPSLSMTIDTFKAYSSNKETVEIVEDFSEASILKSLYTNLVNQDLVYKIQSSASGLIGGFTTVSPNISYRVVGSIKSKSLTESKNVEIYPTTHELYSYTASSRVMPYRSTFDITRTSLFKNNLLKGKQLDYLNSTYWSLTGDYGNLSMVEDELFGKSVLEVTDLDIFDMMYDGGSYVLSANYESAINIRDDEQKVNKIKVFFYNDKNEILNPDGLNLVKANSIDGIDNWCCESQKLTASKIRFHIETSSEATIKIGKIIVRGNATTVLANGLANCYYDNSYVDQNIITVSHLIPVLKDLETEQFVPIQFKNGKISAYGQIRPNPGLNLSSSFISKNILSGYGSKSKLNKLNMPWVRRFYYDHAGVEDVDSLRQAAYFHKYDVVMDAFNVRSAEETFSKVNDIFTFTSNKNGKIYSSDCFICSRYNEDYMVLTVGNYHSEERKTFGIDINLEDDDTLVFLSNNMKINRNQPITISDEKLSMTYNCFNLDNYRNNVNSPTVVTNIQLLNNKLDGDIGSFDNREVIYEFEYLPIIYDELKHHISFNIMIKR